LGCPNNFRWYQWRKKGYEQSPRELGVLMANPQPTDAHLRIAHTITEAIMLRDFTKRQRKILDLILRLSWGCGKKEAYIPKQRYFTVVGIYETDIKTELDWLQASKIIERLNCFYWFNKDFEQWQVSRVHPFEPDKLSELLSFNLNGNCRKLSELLSEKKMELSETLSKNLVKDKETKQNTTKFPTHKLASPKESIKEIINKDIYIVPEFVDKDLWNDFLEMRKKIKKPPTDRAKELLIKDLEKLKVDGQDPNEVLKQSIKNNWQGLFPLKQENRRDGEHKGNNQKIRQPGEYSDPDELRKAYNYKP